LDFLDIFFKNNQILDIRKIHPVGAKLFHVDGQTDYSIMEFKKNVTARLNNISETRNKG